MERQINPSLVHCFVSAQSHCCGDCWALIDCLSLLQNDTWPLGERGTFASGTIWNSFVIYLVPSTQLFFGVSSECLNCLRVTQGNSEQPKGTVRGNTHHLEAELIFYVCRSLAFLFQKLFWRKKVYIELHCKRRVKCMAAWVDAQTA